MTSVKSFCPRRTSERRTHSFYLFLLFHIYLQARAVDKYNTGLIALEICLACVWWLSAWLVKCTLLQHGPSLTHSSPWSAVAVAGCHPRPFAQQSVGSTSNSASEGSPAYRFVLFSVAWQSCRINTPINATAWLGFFCASLIGFFLCHAFSFLTVGIKLKSLMNCV